MKFLKNMPIDRKLKWVILLTSFLALMVAGTGFALYDLSTYKKEYIRQMEDLTRITAFFSLPSMQFQDKETGNQILRALGQDRRVLAAALFDAEGKLFTHLARPSSKLLIPLKPEKPGLYFKDKYVCIYRSLIQRAQPQGTLLVCLDLAPYLARRNQFALIFVLVMGVSFAGAYFFSSLLQKQISRPILKLADTASQISHESGYFPRVKKESEDEIGLLVDKFNEMLEQIEKRDKALHAAQHELEDRVQERTRDLVRVNQRLQFEIGIRKRAEEILRSHYYALEMLATGQPIQRVLDSLNEAVEKQLGPQVVCGTLLLDDKREKLLVQSAPNFPPGLIEEVHALTMNNYQLPCEVSIQKKNMVIIEDLQNDPMWKGRNSPALKYGFRACWSFPLLDAKEKVWGAMVVLGKNPRSPSVGDAQTIKSAAILAGTVISKKKVDEDIKNYAQELTRSNQDLDEFASIASHDLQAPLRKVVAFGQRLLENNFDQLDEKGKDYLNRMINASQRMKNLIDDLLNYSRVRSRPRAFQPTDLNQVVADALFDLEYQIEQTQARIETDDLPMIEADRPLLLQVFQNLIGNSLKFCRPDTTPHIQIRKETSVNGVVKIQIKDNGMGFDPSFQERIFRPFERLHPNNQFEGSGIGLALCKKIIERHGGTIQAQSQPGEGTVMCLNLPLKQDNET